MIKKYLVSILFLCIGIITIHAQEPVVKWGKPVTCSLDPSFRIQQLFMPTESGFYALRNAESANVMIAGFILEKYDNLYNLVSSTEIRSTEGVLGNSMNFKMVVPLKEKVAFFMKDLEKQPKSVIVWCVIYCLTERLTKPIL